MNASFPVPNSETNRQILDQVTASMRASRAYIIARVALLWAGVAAILIVALSIALYAYGAYADPKTSADKMATAFAEALERSTLKTTGTVSLDPGNPLKIDPSSKIGLDASGVLVRIDPSSRVILDASGAKVALSGGSGGEGFRPSSAQLGSGSAPLSRAQVTQSYTVFNSTDYEAGRVVTGWNYNPGAETPHEQYCYYNQELGDGTSVKISLANNGTLATQVNNRIKLDIRSAAQNCVWWKG